MSETVERFWCSREGAYQLDDHGFLRDPEVSRLTTRSTNPEVMRTNDLVRHRCLVLLGEPGSGKSTAIRGADRLVDAGVPVVSFDLAAYGSEERLVHEVLGGPAVADWSTGTGELCLVLDSFDEARARVPHLGAVIAERVRRLPSHRLFLRIACRTADWPAGLETSLSETFGAVEVVEILPLRQADAGVIAATWCDSSLFLSEVERAGAGPLAARPLTLRLLARSFGESETLPERGAALYSAGVRSLCEEQNDARRDAGLIGVLSLDERVAVARRIAAATVFGSTSTIWTGAEVEAGDDDLALERIADSAEPTSGGSIAVTMPAVREAARTGLFTSRGGQRLGWAHATFADFLAAEWVVANDLSVAQARPLFVGPDGRCWPQTRLAASWAVVIAPMRFAFLAEADPAAFQGEVELPGDTLRAAVIDGLFSVASTLTTAPWERSYRALQHRGIVDQLRPHLRDADPDRRRLALELASECAAVDLRDDLAAIAIDPAAESYDRVAAGWALIRLPTPFRTAALVPLALDGAMRGDDPADELKGVALLASWPHALSTAEVFPLVTHRRQRNFHGAYGLFLDRFRSGITPVDLDAGLRWLLGDLDSPTHDHILGALANDVLVLAAASPADPAVVNAFARVVVARADHYEGLLFEDFRQDEHRDPLANPLLRRSVATAVLTAKPSDRMLHRLAERGPYSLGVVRADDLTWLADLFVASVGAVRDAVRSLFSWTFDLGLAAHRELVLDMARNHPLNLDLVHTWVDPVALDSPEADEMRRSWEMFHRPQTVIAYDSDDIEERIKELLDQFDNDEAVGFWQTTRLLTVPPGSKHYQSEFDPDLAGMPRWPTLSEELRARLVGAAQRYLTLQSCEPQQWLEKPEIRYHPAEAGYCAMVLLLRLAVERLHQLPATAWIEWAPVLATWSTASANGATWEDKLALLELAGPVARDAVRTALLTRVEASLSAGRRPYAENEAGYIWDQTVSASYLEWARTANAEMRVELIASLAKHDFELLRPLLLEWLEDRTDNDRHRLAAGQLIDSDLERSWPTLKTELDADFAQAQQILGDALSVRGYEEIDHVPPAVLGDIYLWLRARFPPETDPQFDDAHAVGPREQIGHWRDNLLGRLRDHGTPDALDAIRAIASALPGDRWLARTLATAEAALRRNQWSPTPLPQLLGLAANRRSILVNDAAALAAAAAAALDEVQVRLTGGTPESHYLWDTYAKRPKSEDEISDYLANELGRVLEPRGAIVNREVQIRRNRPSGVGERTDLLIDAAPVGRTDIGRLSLPIEVKGAWNDELFTAVSDQLVDRYMHDIAAVHGVYVVAWPDLASWTNTTDNRRAAFARLDRAVVELQLATAAAHLEEQGVQVRIVHLDIPYLRPA